MSLPEPFIIAELGGNHNGSLKRMLKLIEAAADAGTDAVKFQCFTADTLTLNSDRPEFAITEGPWAGRTLYELYTETQTPRSWFSELFDKAKECDVTAFASVFSREDVDFLETLDCPIYKISSFEITDTPLIEYAASKGKPLIISTGMASEDEVCAAYDCLDGASATFLHCVSEYPASHAGCLENLQRVFRDTPTIGDGLSDHTLSTVLPAVAIGMGATVIEKHLTLSREEGGPDSGFSLEPDEFAEMVHNCWEAWQAIQPVEQPTPYKGLRRSLYACADIAEGDTFTTGNVRSVRPGAGLAPKHLSTILGTTARRNIKYAEPLTEDDL